VTLLEKGDFDQVHQLKDQLLHYYQKRDDLKSWISFCKKIGVQFDELGFPLQSIAYFEEASLKSIWRKPKNEVEWDSMLTIYTNLAYVLDESMDNYKDAKAAYENALQIFDNNLSQDSSYIGAYILAPLGNISNKLGDFEASEVYIKRHKRIAESNQDWYLVANACSDLAILYLNMQEYEQGIQACKEGLATPDLGIYSKGLIHGNYARLLREIEDFEGAQAHIQKAYDNFDFIHKNYEEPIFSYFMSQATDFISELYLAQGKYEEAEQQIQKAEQLLLDYHENDKNRDFAKHYCLKAKLYQSWNKYDLALESAHKALQSLLDDFKTENISEQPTITMLYAENTLQEALAYKAEALASLAEQKNDVQFYLKALECHDLIFEVEKQLRRSHSYETSKLYVVEESRERSERAIQMAIKVWEWTKDDQYKEKALAFAERSKSILLLEAFNQVEAAQLANIPDSLLAEEKLYKARIALLEKKIFEYGDEEGKLETELLQLRQAYNTWITLLEESYPAYYNLKYNFSTLSLTEIRQQLLDDQQAYLEYFVGQENIFVFYISKSTFDIIEIEKDFPLEEWVSTFRKDIEAFQFPDADRQKLLTSYNHLALQLYNKLLKPISNLPKQLTIIPSGILGYLPFEALITAQPQKVRDFKSYAYLINDHVINYAYSISLQKSLMERKSSGHAYAGFAPAFEEGANFSSLDYNQSAVQKVAKTLRGTAILGQKASKNAFTNQSGDYQLIQLATHAIANPKEGDFSFIVFADDAGGYDSMFVKDVYLLDLSADLVMLSACETAVGTLFQGEGIINLARAFFYAGSKSVVTTLWSINEEANEKITTTFYKCLKTGESKSEALRTAKLKYLEQSEAHYAHPVYWAAFTPIGNMEAVYSSFNYTWIVLGGLVGLVLLVLFGRKFV
jgi:CHAT domain-containing protein